MIFLLILLTTALFNFFVADVFIYSGYRKSWIQEVFEREQPILEHKSNEKLKFVQGTEYFMCTNKANFSVSFLKISS